MFVLAALYLLLVNLLTVFVFWADKRAAERGQHRTPENTLLTLATLGGTPGAFVASHLFRHKTRKQPFRATLWLIALAQAGLAGWLYARGLDPR